MFKYIYHLMLLHSDVVYIFLQSWLEWQFCLLRLVSHEQSEAAVGTSQAWGIAENIFKDLKWQVTDVLHVMWTELERICTEDARHCQHPDVQGC